MTVKEKSAPTLFYYQLMGQIIGPINGIQLRQAAVDSDIDQFTPVRVGDESEWVPASRLTKLFHSNGKPIRFEELGASSPPNLAQSESSANASNDFLSMISEMDNHNTKRSNFLDLHFENFVTPQLVRFLYLVSLSISLATIGLAFFWGFDRSWLFNADTPSLASRLTSGGVSALIAIIFCSLGMIAVRVLLEAIMVFFRMCKHLENISRLTAKGVH